MTETPKRKHRLRKLSLSEISLVDAGADPRATIEIYKRKGSIMDAEVAKELKKANDALVELQKKVDAETARANAAEAALAKAQADTAKAKDTPPAKDGNDDDALLKALDPSVAQEIIKLRKSNAAAEEQLAKIADEKRTAEFTAIAKADMSRLAAKPEELGTILKKAAGSMAEDDFAELRRVLKAASDTMAVMGSAMGGAEHLIVKGRAETALEAAATDIAKRDSLSHAKAYAKALEENPALYRQYLEENGQPVQ